MAVRTYSLEVMENGKPVIKNSSQDRESIINEYNDLKSSVPCKVFYVEGSKPARYILDSEPPKPDPMMQLLNSKES